MQALILAGGEGRGCGAGSRPQAGRPLVEAVIVMLDWLRTHGVEDIVISCGHMAAGVRNVLGDGSAFGVRCATSRNPALGTGGALKYVESLLDARFLMLNGDVLTDIDLSASSPSTMATGRRRRWPYRSRTPGLGLVQRTRRARGTEFVEKRAGPDRHAQHLRRRLHLERDILDMLQAEQPARSSATSSRSSSATVSTAACRRLLARHRDARALPRGDVRHPRGHARHCVHRARRRQHPRGQQTSRTRGRIISCALVGSGCVIGYGARVCGWAVLEAGVIGRFRA